MKKWVICQVVDDYDVPKFAVGTLRLAEKKLDRYRRDHPGHTYRVREWVSDDANAEIPTVLSLVSRR